MVTSSIERFVASNFKNFSCFDVVILMPLPLLVYNNRNLEILQIIFNMYIKSGLSSMDAIKRVAKERKIPKSVVYSEYHIGGDK